jgi:hypothetical protein
MATDWEGERRGEIPNFTPDPFAARSPLREISNPSSTLSGSPSSSQPEEVNSENPRCSHLEEVDDDLGERFKHIWRLSELVGANVIIDAKR